MHFMTSIKKILVDLDPNREKQPALTRAIYLAKEFDATLTLFLVVYNRGLISNLFFDSEQLESAKKGYINSQKKWVDSYLNEVVDQGVKVDIDIVWAKPVYEAINKKADAGNYDLVIKSTHSHPAINKIFFTPNDWQLIKTSNTPIVLTKEGSSKSYKNILAAIDPSNQHNHSEELDPKILSSAKFIAESLNSTPHVAHCYDPIAFQMWTDIGVGMGVGMGPADFSMGQENYDQYVEQLKKDTSETFNKAINQAGYATENLHLVEGYPEKILPKLVKDKGIDLLVMGTSYHSGLIGSTVEKILDEVECDILAVKV
jgi:universal stress protein E